MIGELAEMVTFCTFMLSSFLAILGKDMSHYNSVHS